MDIKNEIREKIWKTLEQEKAAPFPGARGRIPNFMGAGIAVPLVSKLPKRQRSKNIKCNPNSPEKPVSALALSTGKTIYTAVPRLRGRKCFIELDPSEILSDDR
jgi:5-formyltetrahydrofolate cyclo-ligase